MFLQICRHPVLHPITFAIRTLPPILPSTHLPIYPSIILKELYPPSPPSSTPPKSLPPVLSPTPVPGFTRPLTSSNHQHHIQKPAPSVSPPLRRPGLAGSDSTSWSRCVRQVIGESPRSPCRSLLASALPDEKLEFATWRSFLVIFLCILNFQSDGRTGRLPDCLKLRVCSLRQNSVLSCDSRVAFASSGNLFHDC